jgi:hypothetical protein
MSALQPNPSAPHHDLEDEDLEMLLVSAVEVLFAEMYKRRAFFDGVYARQDNAQIRKVSRERGNFAQGTRDPQY